MARRYRILLSKRVASDLERIFDHIAKDSPDAAAKMVDRILGSIERLKMFPHRNVVMGSLRGSNIPCAHCRCRRTSCFSA